MDEKRKRPVTMEISWLLAFALFSLLFSVLSLGVSIGQWSILRGLP